MTHNSPIQSGRYLVVFAELGVRGLKCSLWSPRYRVLRLAIVKAERQFEKQESMRHENARIFLSHLRGSPQISHFITSRKADATYVDSGSINLKGSWFFSTGAAEDGRAPTEELTCLWGDVSDRRDGRGELPVAQNSLDCRHAPSSVGTLLCRNANVLSHRRTKCK